MEVMHYFAYGSNMNPARVRERGLQVAACCGASLEGMRLVFDKVSRQHPNVAHANIVYAPGERVEGVLYRLASAAEILKMDPFERAPWNYGRDVVLVRASRQLSCAEGVSSAAASVATAKAGGGGDCPEGLVPAWTYFANQAARREGLKPPAEYLAHLLAGRDYLSADYFAWLRRIEVAGDGR